MKTATLSLLVLALAGLAQASVECKVGDKWYPYSVAECGKSTDFRQAPSYGSGSRATSKQVERTPTGGWKSERPAALARCQKRYDSYNMQNLCLENEEDAYRSMQGDYGLPQDKAAKAKDRCGQRYDSWNMRNLCMKNEGDSYRKLNR